VWLFQGCPHGSLREFHDRENDAPMASVIPAAICKPAALAAEKKGPEEQGDQCGQSVAQTASRQKIRQARSDAGCVASFGLQCNLRPTVACASIDHRKCRMREMGEWRRVDVAEIAARAEKALSKASGGAGGPTQPLLGSILHLQTKQQ